MYKLQSGVSIHAELKGDILEIYVDGTKFFEEKYNPNGLTMMRYIHSRLDYYGELVRNAGVRYMQGGTYKKS